MSLLMPLYTAKVLSCFHFISFMFGYLPEAKRSRSLLELRGIWFVWSHLFIPDWHCPTWVSRAAFGVFLSPVKVCSFKPRLGFKSPFHADLWPPLPVQRWSRLPVTGAEESSDYQTGQFSSCIVTKYNQKLEMCFQREVHFQVNQFVLIYWLLYARVTGYSYHVQKRLKSFCSKLYEFMH